MLLRDLNQPEAAYALGKDITAKSWDNPMTLNQIAWFVVDEPDIERRNLLFAMMAADRASELTEHKDAAILDTVARVYFEMGDLSEAIKYQRKAVEYAPENQMGQDIKATLEKYMKLKRVK